MNPINPLHKVIPSFLTLTLVSLAFMYFGTTTVCAQGADTAALKVKAAELFGQTKLIEAFPLYEKLAADEPSDARIHYDFAFCLLAKANNTVDAESKRQMRARARQEFEKAKQLHIEEPNINGLLDSLPPDGAFAESGFSTNKQASEYMTQAEAKFARGRRDATFDLCQIALM